MQLLFFLPVAEGGRALDVGLWSGGPLLLRVDRLSLLFGVVWAVVLALAALAAEGNHKRWAGLVTLGLLGAAYAREPILFYLGWEVAGLGVWLSAPVGEGGRAKVAALVHGPGLALPALIVMGGAGAFVPPEGGAGREWTLAAVLLMAVAAGGRAIAPVLYSRLNIGITQGGWLMLAVFGSTGPFLLAKALVEARWDDWGVWALTLVGTVGLLAVGAIAGTGGSWPMPLGGAVAAVAIIGLGVAPVSPVAAMGAVLLVGLGAFLPLLSALEEKEAWWQWAMGTAVAASAAGAWMVAQGALGSRYALTGVVVLPVLVLVAGYVGVNRAVSGTGARRWVLVAAPVGLSALAVYPQAGVEWFARPAVGAMAGGVGASSGLVSEWGLGLVARGPAELLTAALPATGIAVAAFVAWVVLYWLRGLQAILAKRRSPSEPK